MEFPKKKMQRSHLRSKVESLQLEIKSINNYNNKTINLLVKDDYLNTKLDWRLSSNCS